MRHQFRHLFRLAAFCTVFYGLLPVAASAEEGSFPGIENLMTWQEFTDAGLDKLTPEERKALNQWLIRYTANEAGFIRATDPEVKQTEQQTVVNARLVKDFSGWDGKTYFYLDNGQVWQQRMTGTYHYSGEAPEVEFKKNFMGYWTMTVLPTGMSVGVKRIK